MNEDNEDTAPWKQPAGLKFVSDYIGPINALMFFGITLVDILTPRVGRAPALWLIGGAIVVLVGLVVWELKVQRLTRTVGRRGLLLTSVVLLFGLGMFSAKAALASAESAAGKVAPELVAMIQKDFGIIREQNHVTHEKLDMVQQSIAEVKAQNNALADLIAKLRPNLEKAITDEVPSFPQLKRHQQDALVLFTNKVGTNGLKRYSRLRQSIKTYSAKQTRENAQAVARQMTVIVQIGGKNIQDEQANRLIQALFLDPETYRYLAENGPPPTELGTLTFLHIDPQRPLDEQLTDPLGDFIRAAEARGVGVPEPTVVIPTEQKKSKPTKHGWLGMIS